MRCAAGGAQLQPQHAARGEPEPVVGRLAVDQVAAAVTRVVRHARAVAAALLSDDEEQTDGCLAVATQPIRGGDLRGQDPLGVACAAAAETIPLETTRKERRDAIDMRGENDRCSAGLQACIAGRPTGLQYIR